MTQQEFAIILDISQGSVAKYENNVVIPKAITLCKIARLAGISMENLVKQSGADRLSTTSEPSGAPPPFVSAEKELIYISKAVEVTLNNFKCVRPKVRKRIVELTADIIKASIK